MKTGRCKGSQDQDCPCKETRCTYREQDKKDAHCPCKQGAAQERSVQIMMRRKLRRGQKVHYLKNVAGFKVPDSGTVEKVFISNADLPKTSSVPYGARKGDPLVMVQDGEKVLIPPEHLTPESERTAFYDRIHEKNSRRLNLFHFEDWEGA